MKFLFYLGDRYSYSTNLAEALEKSKEWQRIIVVGRDEDGDGDEDDQPLEREKEMEDNKAKKEARKKRQQKEFILLEKSLLSQNFTIHLTDLWKEYSMIPETDWTTKKMNNENEKKKRASSSSSSCRMKDYMTLEDEDEDEKIYNETESREPLKKGEGEEPLRPQLNVIIRQMIPGLHLLTDKYYLTRQLLQSHQERLKRQQPGIWYLPPSFLIRRKRIEGPVELPTPDLDGPSSSSSSSPLCWFLKESHKNRAEGIEILTSLHDFQQFTHPCSRYVLQQQVANLLLIDNTFKFDVRIMVLLRFDSARHLWIFIFKEGVIRQSNTPFINGSINKLSQLTNVCFQTREDSKTVSYCTKSFATSNGKLFTTLTTPVPSSDTANSNSTSLLQLNPQSNEAYEIIYSRIKEIVVDVIKTTKVSLNKFRFDGFTLLGWDFLIDKELRPWLLEVNFGPSMFHGIPGTEDVLKRCIHEIPDLVLTPIALQLVKEGKIKLEDNEVSTPTEEKIPSDGSSNKSSDWDFCGKLDCEEEDSDIDVEKEVENLFD